MLSWQGPLGGGTGIKSRSLTSSLEVITSRWQRYFSLAVAQKNSSSEFRVKPG